MDLVYIDALGPNGEYRTRNREVVTTTAGVPVAELSIVPPLYVSRTISAQRKVRPLPAAQREAALAKAYPEANLNINQVFTFEALLVAADAYKRASSTDPKALADAIRATNITNNIAIGDGIRFDAKGQNDLVHDGVTQNRGGKNVVLAPKEASNAKPEWPMKPYQDR